MDDGSGGITHWKICQGFQERRTLLWTVSFTSPHSGPPHTQYVEVWWHLEMKSNRDRDHKYEAPLGGVVSLPKRYKNVSDSCSKWRQWKSSHQLPSKQGQTIDLGLQSSEEYIFFFLFFLDKSGLSLFWCMCPLWSTQPKSNQPSWLVCEPKLINQAD